MDYIGADCGDTGDGSCQGLPEVTVLSPGCPGGFTKAKEASMISTVVLMGTLVTLLIVQD